MRNSPLLTVIPFVLATSVLSCGNSDSSDEQNGGGKRATPPALTFTARVTNTDADFQALATNGNVIVATGPSVLLYSEDGVTWQEPAEHLPAHSVTYGNRRFVATGPDSQAFVSNDGIAWITTDMNPSGMTDFWATGISFAFDRFYATSPELEPGTYVASTDAVIWELVTAEPSSVSTTWSSMEHTSAAGALLVMSSGILSNGNFATFDGSTWEPIPGFSPVIFDMVHDGQRYCAATSFSSAVSEDGRTWSPTTTIGLGIYGVTRYADAFYGVSSGGKVLASYDCLKWGPAADPPLPATYYFEFGMMTLPLDLHAIRVHKDRLVVAGRNGTIFTSP